MSSSGRFMKSETKNVILIQHSTKYVFNKLIFPVPFHHEKVNKFKEFTDGTCLFHLVKFTVFILYTPQRAHKNIIQKSHKIKFEEKNNKFCVHKMVKKKFFSFRQDNMNTLEKSVIVKYEYKKGSL